MFSLADFGIPAIFPWGETFLPFLPRADTPMKIVIGKPLQLPKIDSPTPADVDTHHAEYVKRLRELFESHRGSGETDLEMW